MRKNYRYGRLVNDEVVYADWGKTAGCWPIVCDAPEEPAKDGFHWERSGWIQREDRISMSYVEVENPPPPVSRYSVPDLFWWAKGKGKGEIVDAMLEKAGVYTVAVTTAEVAEDNPLFDELIEKAKIACGLTDEDVKEALDYARI